MKQLPFPFSYFYSVACELRYAPCPMFTPLNPQAIQLGRFAFCSNFSFSPQVPTGGDAF
jgi:hypothetical protein